jgi:hypothetical protein
VSFQSGQLIRAGEEVFNNYGPKANEHFLLAYGFVLDPNPCDSFGVALRASGLSARAAWLLDTRCEVLRAPDP